MGYYTGFRMTIENESFYKIQSRILDEYGYSIEEDYYSEYKFYEYNGAFLNISEEYKDATITLYGLNKDDLYPWKKVYKNGKCKSYSISYSWTLVEEDEE